MRYKETIAVGDSAKPERSGTTSSAEPGCPNSGSCDRFPVAVHDDQWSLGTRGDEGNPCHPRPTQNHHHAMQSDSQICHRRNNRFSYEVKDLQVKE